MGSRLSKRLIDAGHTVIGYNRTPEKARHLIEAGMRLEKSPRIVAAACDAVFSMVTDDSALRAVALGPEGIVAGLKPGEIYGEMSTVSPEVIREIGDAVAARGAAMLDVPISGSTITVEQGTASIAAGGDAAAIERVRPYLLAMAPNGITHVGALGLAKAMKIATNLGLPVQMLAFAEAVLLAEKAGIPRAKAVEALMKSVVASPMIKYRGPFVLGQMPREAWFPVPMIQKDLRLALELGEKHGVPLPTTAVVQEMMTAARGQGLGDLDFAVVFDVLARLSGLPESGNRR
jgi:3-hydroxyisobutyrate dehydrogenase-like beta-hydroxyacid dehydrogenase